ncbi:hypothetical protein BJ742DRAFT_840878 [Cladochytrium replicatum]|nr:hypothetical protein BJ742DRAFT_840878 [Cladochytrium replicatum]
MLSQTTGATGCAASLDSLPTEICVLILHHIHDLSLYHALSAACRALRFLWKDPALFADFISNHFRSLSSSSQSSVDFLSLAVSDPIFSSPFSQLIPLPCDPASCPFEAVSLHLLPGPFSLPSLLHPVVLDSYSPSALDSLIPRLRPFLPSDDSSIRKHSTSRDEYVALLICLLLRANRIPNPRLTASWAAKHALVRSYDLLLHNPSTSSLAADAAESALVAAASRGHLSIIRYFSSPYIQSFLSRRALPVLAPHSSLRYRCSVAAAKNNHIDSLRFLLRGADGTPFVSSCKDKILCAGALHLQIVTVLHREYRADLNYSNNLPLRIAASKGATDVVKYILDPKEEVPWMSSEDGEMAHCEAGQLVDAVAGNVDAREVVDLSVDHPMHSDTRDRVVHRETRQLLPTATVAGDADAGEVVDLSVDHPIYSDTRDIVVHRDHMVDDDGGPYSQSRDQCFDTLFDDTVYEDDRGRGKLPNALQSMDDVTNGTNPQWIKHPDSLMSQDGFRDRLQWGNSEALFQDKDCVSPLILSDFYADSAPSAVSSSSQPAVPTGSSSSSSSRAAAPARSEPATAPSSSSLWNPLSSPPRSIFDIPSVLDSACASANRPVSPRSERRPRPDTHLSARDSRRAIVARRIRGRDGKDGMDETMREIFDTIMSAPVEYGRGATTEDEDTTGEEWMSDVGDLSARQGAGSSSRCRGNEGTFAPLGLLLNRRRLGDRSTTAVPGSVTDAMLGLSRPQANADQGRQTPWQFFASQNNGSGEPTLSNRRPWVSALLASTPPNNYVHTRRPLQATLPVPVMLQPPPITIPAQPASTTPPQRSPTVAYPLLVFSDPWEHEQFPDAVVGAATNDHGDIVRILLQHPESLSTLSKALACASKSGNVAIVSMIFEEIQLRTCPVDHSRGSTSAHRCTWTLTTPNTSRLEEWMRAAIDGHALSVLHYFASRGLRPHRHDTNHHLLLSARSSDIAMVEYLVTAFGAQVSTIQNECVPKCAELGDVAMLRCLLRLGADPRAPVGTSAGVPLAARNGHLEALSILLDSGADPSAECDAALSFAASENNLDILKLLLRHGVDPTAKLDHAIREACENGHVEIVRTLLAATPAVDIHSHDDYALLAASKNGHLGVVNLLLSHSTQNDTTFASSSSSWWPEPTTQPHKPHGSFSPSALTTALESAIAGSHLPVVHALLSTNWYHPHGAPPPPPTCDPKILSLRQRRSSVASFPWKPDRATTLAASLPTPHLLTLLVSHSVPLDLALSKAVEAGNAPAVQLLLSTPPPPLTRPIHPSTISHHLTTSTRLNHPSIVHILLSDPRCDPNALNAEALILASELGHTEPLTHLLAHNADPTLRNSDALQYATLYHRTDAIAILLAHSKAHEMIHANGDRVLRVAVGTGSAAIVRKFMAKEMEVGCEAFVEVGGCCDSLVSEAMERGFEEVVEELLLCYMGIQQKQQQQMQQQKMIRCRR